MTHARPALDVLAELRRGRLAAEFTDALAGLIATCQDTGKKGSISLTLSISPVKVADGDTARIEVSDVIATKAPRRTVSPSSFFLTDDHRPVRRDPQEDDFSTLRDVSADDVSDRTTDRKAN